MTVPTAVRGYTVADAPNIALRLRGDEFRFVLAALKVMDKAGRFGAPAIAQEIGESDVREVLETAFHLSAYRILAPIGGGHSGYQGWTFNEVGEAVAKHVRKIQAKRDGKADPDARASVVGVITRSVGKWGVDVLTKVVIFVLGAVALAVVYYWLNRHGINIHPPK